MLVVAIVDDGLSLDARNDGFSLSMIVLMRCLATPKQKDLAVGLRLVVTRKAGKTWNGQQERDGRAIGNSLEQWCVWLRALT